MDKNVIEQKGFEFQEHTVVTKDGYVLTMHRIYNSTNHDAKPVLLQHGLSDCSEVWVINSPQQAPGFKLARAGFDVWLGNNRGNYYSKRHVRYSPDEKKFWEFDWE